LRLLCGLFSIITRSTRSPLSLTPGARCRLVVLQASTPLWWIGGSFSRQSHVARRVATRLQDDFQHGASSPSKTSGIALSRMFQGTSRRSYRVVILRIGVTSTSTVTPKADPAIRQG